MATSTKKTPEPEPQPEPDVWLKPRFPISVFGARENAWPEIGPESTRVTAQQARDAVVVAHDLGVELDIQDPPVQPQQPEAAPEPNSDENTGD